MTRTPQWIYDHLACIALSAIEDNPGRWTAWLCRYLNDVPRTEEGVIYCGLCRDYANPRKRERAERYAAMPTLPGIEPPYQLHGPCGFISLRQLQGMLYKLRDQCLMTLSEEGAVIPDTRNHRGWDYATRWHPT